ncbi:hypothetical protein EDC01DRAFT_635308 [Geopyxis carbonaria]|nr:hypothetical protein EDC01DRAFT_635308 [Geopyxis carbonaria]
MSSTYNPHHVAGAYFVWTPTTEKCHVCGWHGEASPPKDNKTLRGIFVDALSQRCIEMPEFYGSSCVPCILKDCAAKILAMVILEARGEVHPYSARSKAVYKDYAQVKLARSSRVMDIAALQPPVLSGHLETHIFEAGKGLRYQLWYMPYE